jgi:AraC-like DNA-binding protein
MTKRSAMAANIFEQIERINEGRVVGSSNGDSGGSCPICYSGEMPKDVALHPVCVECLHLNGQCEHGKAMHRCLIDADCRVICCLSGKINWLVSVNGRVDEYSIPAGRFGFYSCHGGPCHAICVSEGGSRILQIHFPHATLSALVGEKRLPPELWHPADGSSLTAVVREITPPMSCVIGNIMNALKQDRGLDLYVLAKALEFLWLFCSSRFVDPQPSVSMEDYQAIKKALGILQQNLESPPSLNELAIRVGMSVSKLKSLFPKTCGFPPFEVLRKMRMEKAMTLLAHDGLNVTEAAMEVGYSSLSHFSKAFHKEFSVNPSHVRKRRSPIQATYSRKWTDCISGMGFNKR